MPFRLPAEKRQSLHSRPAPQRGGRTPIALSKPPATCRSLPRPSHSLMVPDPECPDQPEALSCKLRDPAYLAAFLGPMTDGAGSSSGGARLSPPNLETASKHLAHVEIPSGV